MLTYIGFPWSLFECFQSAIPPSFIVFCFYNVNWSSVDKLLVFILWWVVMLFSSGALSSFILTFTEFDSKEVLGVCICFLFLLIVFCCCLVSLLVMAPIYDKNISLSSWLGGCGCRKLTPIHLQHWKFFLCRSTHILSVFRCCNIFVFRRFRYSCWKRGPPGDIHQWQAYVGLWIVGTIIRFFSGS